MAAPRNLPFTPPLASLGASMCESLGAVAACREGGLQGAPNSFSIKHFDGRANAARSPRSNLWVKSGKFLTIKTLRSEKRSRIASE